jgi:Ca2+-binding EF-hand superfamily protein
MKQQKTIVDKSTIEEIFTLIDANNSGTIEFEELLFPYKEK